MKPNNKVRLHPSSIPTLILINLISNNNNKNKNKIPTSILNEVLELSLTCIYEDKRPISLDLWLDRINSIKPVEVSNQLSFEIKSNISRLSENGIDSFNAWLQDLKVICPWSDDEESNVSVTPLHRASPFALYLRRCLLLLGKLTYDDAVKWWVGVAEWCGSSWIESDRRTLRRKMADAYADAKLSQDYQAGKDATSYYDIDDGTSSQSKPQYALLNSAFLEYEAGGWSAAHQSLAEAIQIARHVGDSRCLVACSSLSKRLFSSSPPDDSFEVPSVSEGRPSPTDILWDIKNEFSLGQSTSTLLSNLYTARALYYSPPVTLVGKNKGRVLNWNDTMWESSSQVIASLLWSELGFNSLALLREEICLSMLNERMNVWNIRLSVLSSQAQKMLELNQFNEALKIMLHCVSTSAHQKEMGILEFRAWQCALWNIVELYAQKRQLSFVVNYLAKSSPPVPLHWTVSKSNLNIRTSDNDTYSIFWGVLLLDEAFSLIIHTDYLHALPLLLQALSFPQIVSNQISHLACVCMIIECRLNLHSNETESKRGVEELEMIWSQVLGLQDKRLIAYTNELKGKAIMLSKAFIKADSSLVDVVTLFQVASEGYRKLGLCEADLRVKQVLCLLYYQLETASSSSIEIVKWKQLKHSLVREVLQLQISDSQGVDVVIRVIERISEVVDAVQSKVMECCAI